jgi:Asp-tRNA(Asn)/Glu-tRNA(Gln) amidotransferase C subunit
MDINVLLRRSALKSSGKELLQLEKDLADILQILEQIPQPQDDVVNESVYYAPLQADEPFNDASRSDILKNAKCVENDMFKISN